MYWMLRRHTRHGEPHSELATLKLQPYSEVHGGLNVGCTAGSISDFFLLLCIYIIRPGLIFLSNLSWFPPRFVWWLAPLQFYLLILLNSFFVSPDICTLLFLENGSPPDGSLLPRFNLGLAPSVRRGTLNGVPPIRAGSVGEGSYPIHSLKNEQGRGYTVAIESRLGLHL